MSKDEKMREYIRQRNKAERDLESRIINEKRQARAEERREIIAQLKAGGMTDEDIFRFLGK